MPDRAASWRAGGDRRDDGRTAHRAHGRRGHRGGLAMTGALLSLYRGYRVGRTAVVAPLATIGGAVLPVAFGLISGDRLTRTWVLGIVGSSGSGWSRGRPVPPRTTPYPRGPTSGPASRAASCSVSLRDLRVPRRGLRRRIPTRDPRDRRRRGLPARHTTKGLVSRREDVVVVDSPVDGVVVPLPPTLTDPSTEGTAKPVLAAPVRSPPLDGGVADVVVGPGSGDEHGTGLRLSSLGRPRSPRPVRAARTGARGST